MLNIAGIHSWHSNWFDSSLASEQETSCKLPSSEAMSHHTATAAHRLLFVSNPVHEKERNELPLVLYTCTHVLYGMWLCSYMQSIILFSLQQYTKSCITFKLSASSWLTMTINDGIIECALELQPKVFHPQGCSQSIPKGIVFLFLLHLGHLTGSAFLRSCWVHYDWC